MARYAPMRKPREGYLKSQYGRRGQTFAALDLGTNNCRLLVARPTQNGFHVIDSFSKPVRLGEGLESGNELNQRAIERTLYALEICAKKMRRHGVSRFRSVATEACRRAKNAQKFLDDALERTGITIEVINRREEARLAVSGCRSLLNGPEPFAVVFDIGGGSTQVAWLSLDSQKDLLHGTISVPFGVVTLCEKYGSGSLHPKLYQQIIDEVGEKLAAFCACHKIAERCVAGQVQMIGTSGTVTTLAGIEKRLVYYDRKQVDGSTLTFAAIRKLCNDLCRMDISTRAKVPCIGKNRADLVIVGCAVLEAMCRRWPVGKLRVADRGIREGILRELMAEADREGHCGPLDKAGNKLRGIYGV
ncbi:MAG: Ppx/GppA phosphatase family protein [Pseudomonadota bacterium]|nr:Ppx/GppA phosphatase family protein [Pseudomonadota bacterium]